MRQTSALTLSIMV